MWEGKNIVIKSCFLQAVIAAVAPPCPAGFMLGSLVLQYCGQFEGSRILATYLAAPITSLAALTRFLPAFGDRSWPRYCRTASRDHVIDAGSFGLPHSSNSLTSGAEILEQCVHDVDEWNTNQCACNRSAAYSEPHPSISRRLLPSITTGPSNRILAPRRYSAEAISGERVFLMHMLPSSCQALPISRRRDVLDVGITTPRIDHAKEVGVELMS